MKICYWKKIAESTSKEGRNFQNQHSEINFNYCRRNCRGDNPSCMYYELKELDTIDEELITDSSLIGRLEEWGI